MLAWHDQAVPVTFAIPPIVRNKARVAGATDWVESLAHLVRDLEVEWSFTSGAVFSDATEALVLEATLADGREAVLKVHIPRAGGHAAHEITVLQLARGDGCPSLYRHDRERGVLLMERLGPSMAQLGIPIEERQRSLCEAAMRVWRPARGVDLPTGSEKGRWLAEFIPAAWERLGRPCSRRAIEHALECAGRRISAHDPERAVLVHGDVHQWNALRSGAGFKLVDPDGLLAEREYDLGVLMREDPVELLDGDPWARAHLLARLTGTDATAIWEWGVVERVSTGLLCTEIDLQPIGRQMLEAAELLAGGV